MSRELSPALDRLREAEALLTNEANEALQLAARLRELRQSYEPLLAADEDAADLSANHAAVPPETPAPEPVLEAEQEIEGESNPWLYLPMERHEVARQSRAAMAEKFGLPETDFSLVRVSQIDKPDKFVIVHSAPIGIDFGDPEKADDEERSYNKIIDGARAPEFIIEVNGQMLDTRTGMTRPMYEAFIQDAVSKGIDPLPDSQMLDGLRVRTLLTGEEAHPVTTGAVFVDEGQVGWHSIYRTHALRALRVRPAVEVPDVLQVPGDNTP